MEDTVNENFEDAQMQDVDIEDTVNFTLLRCRRRRQGMSIKLNNL
jgi:hypothetical protein